jgi:putative membrane protein
MELKNIDAAEFVNEASTKGIAEIESGKLALEKGSDKTKEFAQKLIKDHVEANNKLAELAAKNNLEVSDEAGLMDKAKAMILKVRDESFDEAFANHQIDEHEKAIELFQRAVNSELSDFSIFARNTLPKLEQHLSMAKELKKNYSKVNT